MRTQRGRCGEDGKQIKDGQDWTFKVEVGNENVQLQLLREAYESASLQHCRILSVKIDIYAMFLCLPESLSNWKNFYLTLDGEISKWLLERNKWQTVFIDLGQLQSSVKLKYYAWREATLCVSVPSNADT